MHNGGLCMLKIIGCGGHARSVADIFFQKNSFEVEFYDNNAREKEEIYGCPVYKIEKLLLNSNDKIFIAVGNNKIRADMFKKVQVNFNTDFITIVSKTASVSKTAVIGKGCMIGDFVHIGPDVVIGDNCIINNGAIVEHEVKIGNHCHIGPRVVISGRSVIGEQTFLGVGSVIKDYITIGDNITVGAGAVVVRNLLHTGVYVGVPAVLLKT